MGKTLIAAGGGVVCIRVCSHSPPPLARVKVSGRAGHGGNVSSRAVRRAGDVSAAEPSGGGRVSSSRGGGASTAQGECKQCKGSHKQEAGNRASGAMQGLALYSQVGGLQLATLTHSAPPPPIVTHCRQSVAGACCQPSQARDGSRCARPRCRQW